MKKMIYLMLCLLLSMASVMRVDAQVKIGSTTDPHEGAVLELESKGERGLLLPKLSLNSATVWEPVLGAQTDGMVVYNTSYSINNGLKGKGIYVWTDGKWMGIETIAALAIPATPGPISGPTLVLPNAEATYSIDAVPGATGYDWSIPYGWTVVSQGATSIIVKAAASGSGTISVVAKNSAGSSSPSTLAVAVSVDYTPNTNGTLAISGITCFDPQLTDNKDEGDGPNGPLTDRTSTPKPMGAYPYTVSFSGSGKTISSVVWVVETKGLATYLPSGVTASITFVSHVNDLILRSRKATAAQIITLTAYVTYSDSSKESVSKSAKVQDFACCGVNGIAGTVSGTPSAYTNNTSISYLTHQYKTGNNGTTYQCWMVQNSKEGIPSTTKYGTTTTSPNLDSNGYWYTWTQAKNACPTGWHLPTESESGQLVSVVRNSWSAASSKWWYSGAAPYNGLAGWYDSMPGFGWNPGCSYWWNAKSESGYQSTGTVIGLLPQSRGSYVWWFSVRCVQD